MNATIGRNFIKRTQTIFNDEQWHAVTVPHLIQGNAQTDWVDLPTPIRSFQVWVTTTNSHVTQRICFTITGRSHCRHVVTEAQEVNWVRLQNRLVIVSHGNLHVVLRKVAIHELRIFTTDLDIREEQVQLILHLGSLHIGRIWCGWVRLHTRQHRTNLRFRINLMHLLRCNRTGHKLVVQRLVTNLQLLVIRQASINRTRLVETK